MRRLLALVSSLACVLLAAAALAPRAAAQNPLPRGGVQPMARGGGENHTPWTEWSDPSGPWPTTYDQYPLLRFYWCDNVSLVPETRWVKVNGVDQTASFDYTTQGSNGSCVARASSQTTSVPLNLGSNSIETYICDDEDLGPYCGGTYWNVTRLALPPQAAPIVTQHNFNGDNEDRSQCLTVGAGQAAGLACGDLFVAHGLPAYRTMGRDRSLTLFYSSHQAAPRPTVAVWVSQPSGTQTPNSVYVELKVGGAIRASATYAPWSSASGPRQLVLAYDAGGDTSRLVPFTLEVRNQYTGGNYATTITDTLMVVNRVGSEFGAGWWLAGVEQLVLNQPGNKILWLGGDGSAAVYRPVNGTTWVRASGAFRDTLVLAGGVYTRTLRHGVQVKFNSAGRHIQTVNRTGQTTTFTWSSSLLTSIQVPPGVSGTTYTLVYDGSGQLDSIVDPAGRVLNATVSGGNLTNLLDPDAVGVSFGYDGSRRMTSRSGRRGFATSYAYANGLRVTAVRVPLNATDTALTALEWWDEKGLIVGTPGGTFYSADTLNAFSKVYGARVGVDDNATFWVDRWGAPVRVVGAENDTTIATRSNQSGLVSRARSPVGQVLLANWDARGNLLTLSDSTHEGGGTVVTATTSYSYGDTRYPDSPTEVHAPTGETTVFHYHESLGLPDTITAPGGARTAFAYGEAGGLRGLLQGVTVLGVRVVDTLTWTFAAPASLVTSVAYDALGNDTSASMPSGSRTRTVRDQYGRVYRADDPAGHRTDYAYDLMNRLRSTQVFDTSASHSTVYSYDTSGALWRIQDPRGVGREWSYDWADRDTLMTGEAGYTERRTFDRAGLLVSLRTRTGWTVGHEYDRAGRRTRTVTPSQREERSPALPNPGDVSPDFRPVSIGGLGLKRVHPLG